MTGQPKRVVLVAAVAENGVIGKDGEVPWHLPGDLRHFRETTTGHTVVMGRVTFEGIGHPLPYRTNVVVTRRPDWHADGVFVAGSVEGALALAAELEGDIMVIGGAQVYAHALPLADVQILTEVPGAPAGDTFYPEFDRGAWTVTRRQEYDGYAVVTYERAADPV